MQSRNWPPRGPAENPPPQICNLRSCHRERSFSKPSFWTKSRISVFDFHRPKNAGAPCQTVPCPTRGLAGPPFIAASSRRSDTRPISGQLLLQSTPDNPNRSTLHSTFAFPPADVSSQIPLARSSPFILHVLRSFGVHLGASGLVQPRGAVVLRQRKRLDQHLCSRRNTSTFHLLSLHAGARHLHGDPNNRVLTAGWNISVCPTQEATSPIGQAVQCGCAATEPVGPNSVRPSQGRALLGPTSRAKT